MAVTTSFVRDRVDFIFQTDLMEMGMELEEMRKIVDVMHDAMGPKPGQVYLFKRVIITIEQGE